jgi:steroid delta-isomerase-like uncharacterized protein
MAADSQAATNTEIARRFFTAWVGGDPAAFDEVLAPDYVFHDPADPDTPPGPGGAREMAAGFRAAFADMRPVEEDYIAGGDKVVYRWRVRATHRGEFAGVPATGREVEFSGIEIVRLAGGRIVEHWDEIDALGLLRQLGAGPA